MNRTAYSKLSCASVLLARPLLSFASSSLVISVLNSLKLDEDKVRVSNEGVETLEELRLLHFAAKEREKWSRDSYPQYEKAVEKLYSLNPEGYTHNVSQAWKYHYKMRLGLSADGQGPSDSWTKCMIEAVKFADKAIEINPEKRLLHN